MKPSSSWRRIAARTVATLVVGATTWAGCAGLGSAQAPLGGQVALHGVIGAQEGAGAGGMLDLLWRPESDSVLWGFGGAVGVGALATEDAEVSRVFMPVALSASLTMTGSVWLTLRVRGGGWGGALNAGLVAGPFVSGGAAVQIPISDTAALSLGCDGWLVMGHESQTIIAPGIGFEWFTRTE